MRETREPLDEPKDAWERYVKLKRRQYFGFHLKHLLFGHNLINHSENRLQVRWVNFFVLPCNFQRSNPEALQLVLAHVVDDSQVVVHYADCDVKSFWPHFEFKVKLRKPVDQEGPHFLGYELLALHELGWQQKELLLLKEV